MTLKKILFSAILFLFIFNAYSQEDAYKNCIKRTTIAVYKAQKQMLAGQSTEVKGKLAKAILLQSNAIKYYGDQNKSLSVCYSLLARQYAIEIIQLLSADNKVDAFYQITKEEKDLAANCLGDEQLYKQGKSNFANYSESDKDFLDPSTLSKYIEIK
jgi:hypothetical protein